MRIKKPIAKLNPAEKFLSGREIPTLKSRKIDKIRKRNKK